MYTNTARPREAEGDEQELVRVAKWLQEKEGLGMGEALRRAQEMKAQAEAEAIEEQKKKRAEEAKEKRKTWEAVRTKFRNRYVDELLSWEDADKRALVTVLADIAQALKDISYGQILQNQAKGKKFQNNNTYKK